VTTPLRLAGTARLPDDAILTWTVADGRAGRRWRALAAVAGTVTHALLLEVGPGGRLARLELATAAGLLTVHPDTDGTILHGNVVTSAGVRHVALDWSPDHGLAVDGRPLADAVTARRLAATVGVGEGRVVAVVAIAADLSIREETTTFERSSTRTWRLIGPRGTRTLTIDERGIPADLRDAVEWPLELD